MKAVLRELRIGLAAWLSAAVCAIVLPASAAAASNSSPAWVLGDFDGDRNVDVAVVSPRDHQLHIELTSQRAFASGLPVIGGNRFTVRDLDGDSDNDIVLETAFRQPLAVWLNDGAGNFEEGKLENFYFQLSHGDRQSLESAQLAFFPSDAGECQGHDAISPYDLAFDPKCPGLQPLASREERAPSVSTPILRSRGPPSTS